MQQFTLISLQGQKHGKILNNIENVEKRSVTGISKVESHCVIEPADKDPIRNQAVARGAVSGDAHAVWGHFRGADHHAALIHTQQVNFNTTPTKSSQY